MKTRQVGIVLSHDDKEPDKRKDRRKEFNSHSS